MGASGRVDGACHTHKIGSSHEVLANMRNEIEGHAEMNDQELLGASATEQARLVREGQVSSEELVRMYLQRIYRLNPRLSAFVEIFPQWAFRAARKKDAERRKSPGTLPAFHGIPMGIKDLNVARFMPTRFGSKGMIPILSPIDDLTVAPLRRAGFVMLGKLTTSELGAMPVTEPDNHAPTRNPWSLAHSAGGSSGGSGAAVAAGMLPVAQGSDGGGSIRIPSAFCHLVGLKPSRGRLRNQYGLPDKRVLYTSGALTRTVDDAAAMLDVMAEINDGTPHWAPAPSRPFRELARLAPRRMKIRYTTKSPLATTNPEVAAAVERAVRVLGDLGHEISEAKWPDGSLDEFLPLWEYLTSQMPLVRWDRVQPVTAWLGENGKKHRKQDMDALHAKLESRFRPVFEEVDLWVTPTVPHPAPQIGAFRDGRPEDDFRRAAEIGAFTAMFNVTGQPAISLPIGLTEAGLPMGMQIAGPMFGEATLLAVAKEFEEAMPWAQTRSPEF